MAIDNGRLKHLEIVQQVITRMASNSFLLKGWSVTLLSAILAIAVKDSLYRMIWIAFLPVLMFWMLDGYFLRQERIYRKLWDHIRAEKLLVEVGTGLKPKQCQRGLVSDSTRVARKRRRCATL
jgi:hypothetical protein